MPGHERGEASRRAGLGRDSARADLIPLRVQIQSLETVIITEKLAATGLEDNFHTPSGIRDVLRQSRTQEIKITAT